MVVDDSSLHLKKRRLTSFGPPMDLEAAKEKISALKEQYGRDIRVFDTSKVSQKPNEVPNDEETDDFYEFTAGDYYQILAAKKEDKYLKTSKIREAEEVARRSRITKAVMRVRFPDQCTLEAVFHPSEKIQSLFDLLMNVIAQPELPFYLYTTPPKKQIKDMSQDFYSAGFIPGAIIYFAYDLPIGDSSGVANSGPFLKEEIMSLKDSNLISEATEPVQSEPEPAAVAASPAAAVQEQKPADKKTVKPKWLKL